MRKIDQLDESIRSSGPQLRHAQTNMSISSIGSTGSVSSHNKATLQTNSPQTVCSPHGKTQSPTAAQYGVYPALRRRVPQQQQPALQMETEKPDKLAERLLQLKSPASVNSVEEYPLSPTNDPPRYGSKPKSPQGKTPKGIQSEILLSRRSKRKQRDFFYS